MIEEKVTLKIRDKKKHSVRFDNKESDIVKSLYLMNEAFERLGAPQAINVSISNAAMDGRIER